MSDGLHVFSKLAGGGASRRLDGFNVLGSLYNVPVTRTVWPYSFALAGVLARMYRYALSVPSIAISLASRISTWFRFLASYLVTHHKYVRVRDPEVSGQ